MRLKEAFWNEAVWLPPGASFKQLQEFSGAHFRDLYWAVPAAFGLLLLRALLERIVYRPLGGLFGIKTRRLAALTPQPALEAAHRNGRSKDTQILAKQSNLTERQVARWLRRRSIRDRPSTQDRWCESCFRANFYAFSFSFGLYVLWDKPWLWDSVYCFRGYPHHPVSNEEWQYYVLELGFYLSLLWSQFVDVRRKDFWQMFLHHIVTISLLCFSWACNLVRVGTLVLVIHDFADIPLDGAKLARYVKSETASNIVFAIFTVCWIFSRMGLLPTRVLAYSLYWALEEVEWFPAYFIFNALLVILQILHVIWTWLILRITFNALNNQGVKDLRESDESVADQDSQSSHDD